MAASCSNDVSPNEKINNPLKPKMNTAFMPCDNDVPFTLYPLNSTEDFIPIASSPQKRRHTCEKTIKKVIRFKDLNEAPRSQIPRYIHPKKSLHFHESTSEENQPKNFYQGKTISPTGRMIKNVRVKAFVWSILLEDVEFENRGYIGVFIPNNGVETEYDPEFVTIGDVKFDVPPNDPAYNIIESSPDVIMRVEVGYDFDELMTRYRNGDGYLTGVFSPFDNTFIKKYDIGGTIIPKFIEGTPDDSENLTNRISKPTKENQNVYSSKKRDPRREGASTETVLRVPPPCPPHNLVNHGLNLRCPPHSGYQLQLPYWLAPEERKYEVDSETSRIFDEKWNNMEMVQSNRINNKENGNNETDVSNNQRAANTDDNMEMVQSNRINNKENGNNETVASNNQRAANTDDIPKEYFGLEKYRTEPMREILSSIRIDLKRQKEVGTNERSISIKEHLSQLLHEPEQITRIEIEQKSLLTKISNEVEIIDSNLSRYRELLHDVAQDFVNRDENYEERLRVCKKPKCPNFFIGENLNVRISLRTHYMIQEYYLMELRKYIYGLAKYVVAMQDILKQKESEMEKMRWLVNERFE